ncbi:MAG: helix-turn-helix domain-containing protein [Solirubrobacterales bacterium]|nr:helix-turn-helix domain-containing protein [Solirubrobacterales bacterium]
MAARIGHRVYGQLDAELAQTLDLLIENGFERSRTATALPVHRNTLRARVARIAKLTGIDVDSPYGRTMAWLAWLWRKGAPLP